MKHTVFAKIPSFDGYLASIDGDIISQRTNGGKIDTQRFKYLKGELDKGYLLVKVLRSDNYRIKTGKHRLTALAFLSQSNEHTNHINGNKLDNRIENLEWSSAVNNERHAWVTGLKKKVMSAEDIRVIRNSNLSHKELALKYSTTDRTIRDIRNYHTWRNIE